MVSMLAMMACSEPEATETELFEAAEVHYRGGNYGEALSGYEAFLKRYPASPLAPTVEMRLRNIHREVSSVMERQGSPSPVYHGSRGDQSAAAAPLKVPKPPAPPSPDHANE
ncbi:hypothetical protein FRC96_16220 [Lujinxingia vulgaris]|uniref:Outer membrane lipoprotein BamD-like domain-containing protein n=1 Tax=Lujinxingia vulgaris TaxID=2600176 RepID=A0A5C6X8F7_9DELT|nr:hypothetical protein [Lujinxingia vulgaris]TXD33061.1 hypothetical protein FRC96_16220 [Lujinxingia vulgaris]